MSRPTESTVTKLLRSTEGLTPEQILIAIDILKYRYTVTKPKREPKKHRKVSEPTGA